MQTTTQLHESTWIRIPERLLMGSGPSNVPSRVRQALSQPTIGHLDPAFLELADETNARLRAVFQTENGATLPISGTGSAGMEAAIVNFLEPGDRLVAGVSGIFGERIAAAADRLNVEVERVCAAPGSPVDLDALSAAIRHRRTHAVTVVHGETSTGVAQPLLGLGELAHAHDALLIVDCVTSLGGYPLAIDAEGIDVAFSGTQKCLNCPPGLAPLTASERALARLALRRTPVSSWCFDLEAILEYWSSSARLYHHTPPINAIYALHEALAIVLEEGLEARWARHKAASEALAAGLTLLGFESLVQSEYRLWPLAAVRPPRAVDEGRARRQMLVEHGIEVAGGLGGLAGQIWRVGTMGCNAHLDRIEAVICAAGSVLGADAERVAQASAQATSAWTECLATPTVIQPPDAANGAR